MSIAARTRLVAIATAFAVVLAGCSNKADDGNNGSGSVATDVGVDGDTITLGVLTDLTGVFAALGKDITNANTLYWKTRKVCDRYTVKLDVQDTGYVPQQGVQLYSSIKSGVLAMQQTIGSPINAALAADYEADRIVNFPSAWGETLTDIPGTGLPGATYDVELSNGYDYMFKQGLLKEGDTVGHIYFEGEYGESGLAGTKFVAGKKKLTVVEAQIKATDQDMSAQVSQFKARGVDVIVLTVAPTQTASVAAAAQAQNMRVPILGSNPVFAPGLLQGPTAGWLTSYLHVAAPVSTFDRHPALYDEYTKAYPETRNPSAGVVLGYGMAEIMRQVLDAACERDDLTRQGVLNAFNELKQVDTNGLLVPIDSFTLHRSPSLQSFIFRPADVRGGAKVVQDAFEGEWAEQLAGR
ncbi:ABC transporter substrate-binding protein [Cryptosporangium aurantiacum]|uniref:Amino acid/amide ABC transporter substrate-binding protein, HAAT family n=1 Tax=Cryptosporangium aurantiacum TaxID=134849 RepID=A0A1M7TU05_9ACTN|nr:ABC transporter substrate-binding protein [Cryptosporangium aurantiacum]SHN74201.1 amino acid/amide ABC transporter substrate-binding protein, HAAT family [Cryptosporangium aurantiacum]